MYKLTCVLFLFIYCQFVYGQSCFDNGFSPRSQADVDVLKNPFYDNCRVIGGNVNISGDDITDLSAFRNIEEIHGDLFISGNPQLLSLTGFGKLKLIKGAVRIQSNNALESLEGMQSLKKVEGNYMYIIDLPGVSSLQGLNSLDTVNGIFHITGLNEIRDMSGLDSLKSVKNAFNIFKNDKLQSLNGLDNFIEAGERFGITENPVLSSVEDLREDLVVHGPLVINKNPLLESCKARFICNYLAGPPETFYVINENAASCNLSEVIGYCESVTGSREQSRTKIARIFPNPVVSVLNIGNSHRFDAYILSDISGKEVISGIMMKENIEISALSPGMYILQLKSKSLTESHLIIKK